MSDASASFVACLSRVRGQLARTVLRGGRGREALPLPDTEVPKVTDFSRPKPCAAADFGIPYWRA